MIKNNNSNDNNPEEAIHFFLLYSKTSFVDIIVFRK